MKGTAEKKSYVLINLDMVTKFHVCEWAIKAMGTKEFVPLAESEMESGLCI